MIFVSRHGAAAMLDAFFKKLKHPDPQVRRQAAEELGRLEDGRALGPLEEAFRCDPDPAVRAAAQAAGRRIWQAGQMRAQPPRLPDDRDEDALALQIVADAMDSHLPEAPSLSAESLGVIGMGMLINPPLAMLGMLHQQYADINLALKAQQEMEFHRRTSQAMLDRSEKADLPPPASEAPADIPAWLRESDENDPPPTPPPARPGIRRIKL